MASGPHLPWTSVPPWQWPPPRSHRAPNIIDITGQILDRMFPSMPPAITTGRGCPPDVARISQMLGYGSGSRFMNNMNGIFSPVLERVRLVDYETEANRNDEWGDFDRRGAMLCMAESLAVEISDISFPFLLRGRAVPVDFSEASVMQSWGGFDMYDSRMLPKAYLLAGTRDFVSNRYKVVFRMAVIEP